MRIAAPVLALLCLLWILAGCARLAQPGSLPSDEERFAYAGGMWYSGVPVPGTVGSNSAAAVRAESA